MFAIDGLVWTIAMVPYAPARNEERVGVGLDWQSGSGQVRLPSLGAGALLSWAGSQLNQAADFGGCGCLSTLWVLIGISRDLPDLSPVKNRNLTQVEFEHIRGTC